MSNEIRILKERIQNFVNIEGKAFNRSAMRREALRFNEIDVEYHNPKELYRKLKKFVENSGFDIEVDDFGQTKSEIGGVRGNVEAYIIGSKKEEHKDVLVAFTNPYRVYGVGVIILSLLFFLGEGYLWGLIFLVIGIILFIYKKIYFGNLQTYKLFKIYIDGEVEERWKNEERDRESTKTAVLHSKMEVSSSCEYLVCPTKGALLGLVDIENIVENFDGYLTEKGKEIIQKDQKELREDFQEGQPKLENLTT